MEKQVNTDKSDKINNPHDAFISKVLRQKNEAVSLIKGILPDDIKQKVDYKSLQLSPDTYVNSQLQKSFSDIVYDGSYGDDTKVKVAFIIEHKSYYPERNIKLQLLQYFLGVVNTQFAQNITSPAIPIIILLYHGKGRLIEKPLWKIFGDSIPMEFHRLIPSFDCLLSDFGTYSNEKIKLIFDSFKLRAAVLVMRDIFHKASFKKAFEAAMHELLELKSNTEIIEYIQTILHYLYSYSDDKYKEAENIIEMFKKGDENMETIVDRLLKEGIEEGMEKGMVEGIEKGIEKGMEKGILKQAIITVLGLHNTKNFPVEEIAELTKLSVVQVNHILSMYEIHKDETLAFFENSDFESLH